MIIEVDGNIYEFKYFPFFRIKTNPDFHLYGMKLPSGAIEEVLVFDYEQPVNCLRSYSEFLIKEYVLEEDIVLTDKALKLKADLKELLKHED